MAFGFLLVLTGCNNSEPPSIKCDNCGILIEENSKFCPQCGEIIIEGTDEKESETSNCSHSWIVSICCNPQYDGRKDSKSRRRNFGGRLYGD